MSIRFTKSYHAWYILSISIIFVGFWYGSCTLYRCRLQHVLWTSKTNSLEILFFCIGLKQLELPTSTHTDFPCFPSSLTLLLRGIDQRKHRGMHLFMFVFLNYVVKLCGAFVQIVSLDTKYFFSFIPCAFWAIGALLNPFLLKISGGLEMKDRKRWFMLCFP